MASGKDQHDGRPSDPGEREAQRILKRVSMEAAPGGSSLVGRAARGVRDHVAAADIDPGDRIEHWGTRIGRVLGLLIVAALTVWLLFLLLDRG